MLVFCVRGHWHIYVVVVRKFFPQTQSLFISPVYQTKEEVLSCILWLVSTLKKKEGQGGCKRECKPRGRGKGRHVRPVLEQGANSIVLGLPYMIKEVFKNGGGGVFMLFPKNGKGVALFGVEVEKIELLRKIPS